MNTKIAMNTLGLLGFGTKGQMLSVLLVQGLWQWVLDVLNVDKFVNNFFCLSGCIY
jgi:hypothetical protein